MQYGYFDDQAKEYVITRPDTPQSWSNYLGSTQYGAIITNNAGGYGFYQSGARGRFLRPLLLAASLAATAGTARADITCSFATECLEGEACMDSGFSLTVETALAPGALVAEDGFPTGDRIVTDAETIPVTWAATGPALAAARQAGMGVIVKEALANGRLTPRNAANPEFRDPYAVLQAQADRLQTTVDALALAAVLAQPWADVVLSGAAQADHLRANLAALRNFGRR